MLKNMWADLTEGRVGILLAKMALPLMAGSLIEVAYSVTDMYWVSRLGDRAVAAVGTGGLILWFFTGFLEIIAVGVGVVVGNQLGAHRPWVARRNVASGLLISILLPFVLSILGWWKAPVLISWFHLNDQYTQDAAVLYLRYLIFSAPFYACLVVWARVVVASGWGKLRFVLESMGLIMNMILDPLLIYGLDMGVAGAALASAIAMSLEGVIIWFVASRKRLYQRLRVFSLRHRWGVLLKDWGTICKIGAPVGVQTMCFALINSVISRYVAFFGDLAVSAYRVGATLESISWATAVGLGSAVTAVVAQNYGAGQIHRVRQAFWATVKLSCAVGSVGTVLFLFFPHFVASLFLSEPEAVAHGVLYLRCNAPSQIFMILEIAMAAFLGGMGRTFFPSAAIVVITLLRLPLIYVFGPLWGTMAVWLAICLTTIGKGVTVSAGCWLYLKKYE